MSPNTVISTEKAKMNPLKYILENQLLLNILAITCFAVTLFLMVRELHAERKRKQIHKIEMQIRKPLGGNTGIRDAVTMGATAVGISLLDIYATLHKHADVLDVLEQRFPHANGANDMWDWFNKISYMFEQNADSLDTYVSCFKGQAAENIAVQMLREQGMDAELFESLTNADNDILVSLRGGREAYYSVKCGDADYIKRCIKDSDATKYIINSESYEELESEGLIEIYEQSGIHIINGNYSDYDLTQLAENAFEDIHEAGDVTESIPYVALAVFGIKTYQNVKQLQEGKQTRQETLSNIEMDVVRLGTAGLFASVGSEVGAYIGTMLLPGVGTVLGAGIGVIGGALMGSSLIEWGKEQLKWGKIIAAQDYFGNKFENNFSYHFSSKAVDKYLKTASVTQALNAEQKLLDKYAVELNPYKLKRPGVSAVLSQEYYRSLDILKKRMDHTKLFLGANVKRVCAENVGRVEEKKREKYARRLLGELIIGNYEHLGGLTQEESALLKEYWNQKQVAGNYPYQFSHNPREVMEQIVKQTFNNCRVTPNSFNGQKVLSIFFIVLFLLLGSSFGVLSVHAELTGDTTHELIAEALPTLTPTPERSPVSEPTPTSTATPSPEPVLIITPSPTPMPTATPTATPSPTATPTPIPVEAPACWSEIEGLNTMLAEEIKLIDPDIFDSFRTNREFYQAQGFYCAEKFAVPASNYHPKYGKAFFSENVADKNIYINESFQYVRFFFNHFSTYGDIGIVLYPSELSSQLPNNITYEALIALWGMESYRLENCETSDFAATEASYGVGYEMDDVDVLFLFDVNNNICDLIYLSVNPGALE